MYQFWKIHLTIWRNTCNNYNNLNKIQQVDWQTDKARQLSCTEPQKKIWMWFVNLTGSASAFVAKLKHWKRVTLPLAYHLSSQMMTIAVYINTCIHVFVFIFLWASFSMFSGVSVSTSFSHQSPVFLHLLSPLVSQYLLPSFKKISLNLAPLLLSLVVISSEKEVSNQFLFGWRKKSKCLAGRK